ncbi:MutS-related protein [Ulvibacterium marinum]|uniref:DNA mismatch repair protein MutS n=1 Tax=Ulvibacterium marinum TaxID=2419782 RepID=A0A3B0C7K4_9FLAO|nr:DNA mismatch repair protein MutS [Ulvibacterium marinum]RKN79397.1 DNA mismatch repair protein MutS [Ulvibacterium marinum]
MQDAFVFYTEQIKKHKTALSLIKRRLFVSSMIRLAVFASSAIGIYFLFGNTPMVWGIVLITFILFLFLVSRHTDLQYQRDKLRALLQLNETEIEVLNRNFHQLPEGNEFKDSGHFFSQDIDLFGRGSFYQYCNRTALQQGSETLAKILTGNTIESIPQKQEALKELSQIPEWRQNFSAIATLVRTETKYTTIIKWIQNYRPFMPAIMKILPTIFSVLSLMVWTLYFLDTVSEWFLVGWFFLGLGITGRFLGNINKLSADTSKIQSTFQQYQKLITELEQMEFTSDLLSEKRSLIIEKTDKASRILKKFSRLLNALDQRNNIIIGLFANAFMLRDLQLVYAIEDWFKSYGSKVEGWFQTIAFFDAYNSLGNFVFNHPSYCFPSLSEEEIILESEKAGHPLLDPDKSVLNNFKVGKEQFFIITGANMAGKSTFLRTVSLHIVMANIGLPVCASKVRYSPIKLITSMRTTDSLTDEESYFFSELKRLKFIVDEIQRDRYFIVLDEILKGTNSSDKAKGSRKFVEKLVRSRSTGIIATHDLSLCDAANELDQIRNYYFDAEIIDNELHFDYKLKAGICQNMNASFLLKKMEIVE